MALCKGKVEISLPALLETLSEAVFKDFDLRMLTETDWPLYLRFFMILSGLSTGKARSGSGLLLVYLFEARVFLVEPLNILLESPRENTTF